MQSPSDVVVWEYESDIQGLFVPYEDKISNNIENAFAQDPTEQHLQLGTFDHLLLEYEVDFNGMIQTNKKPSRRNRQRAIRRQTYSGNSTIGSGIVWQWMTEKGWVVYDSEAIDAIEKAYNQGKPECDLALLKFGLPNTVLIHKGYQKNKNTGFVRPVQRIVFNYKTKGNNHNESIATGLSTSTMNSVNAPLPNNTGLQGNIGAAAGLHGGARVRSGQMNNPRTNNAAQVNNVQANNTSCVKMTRKKSENSASGKHKKMKSSGSSAKPVNVNPTLSPFAALCQKSTKDEECAICLSSLVEDNICTSPENVLELKICKHKFHESCLEALYKNSHNQQNCLRCPLCKQIHGVLKGDQPPGRMTHRIDMTQSVSGCEGDGMIIITYDIPGGIQNTEHPNPGVRYFPIGFPRTAYLPANKKGKKCLKLLQIAFDRRLTFTIGTSSTTGQDNCVTWTNIHHKTVSHDNRGHGHGYPDPSYLDNLIEELKNVGVSEIDLNSH